MGLKLNGATSGSIEIDVPAVAGTDTAITIPATSGGEFIVSDSSGNIDLGPLDINGGAADDSVNIDGSGRLLVGTSTARLDFFNSTSIGPAFQIEGNAIGNRIATIVSNSTSSGAGAVLALGHEKSGSTGGSTAVANDDLIGRLSFQGHDGTTFVESAFIESFVDADVGTDDMPGRLVFSCTADNASSPTERMRISSNSTYYFNTTFNTNYGQTNDTKNTGAGTQGNMTFRADTGALVLANKADSGFSAVYINKYNWDSGDDSRFIDFRVNGGSAVGTISFNGSGTSYNTSSDYRLKENVVVLTDGIDRLKQLNVNRFNFISNPEQTVDGFLAHEVQTVVPEAISGVKDEVDDEGNPVYQGIDQSKLVPLLTAALQEAIAKIETLEAKVAQLEGGAA